LVSACLLVIIGAFAQLYVIIIGGQAFPLNIFPGYVVESSFFDGAIGEYTPSLWEFLLGFGGVGIAALIALLGIRVLPIMPESLPAEIE
jgi:molybdopterin-containing oxidoreductase family membrane subunit